MLPPVKMFQYLRKKETPAGENYYQCNYCQESYKNIHHLRAHQQVYHPLEKPEFKKISLSSEEQVSIPNVCQFCQEKFYDKKNFNLHQMEKHSEKLHKCQKTFCNKKHLNSHQRICNNQGEKPDEKPLKCRRCAFICFHEKTLAKHIEVFHDENADPEKPYKCNFCHLRFTINTLPGHMMDSHSIQIELNAKDDDDVHSLLSVKEESIDIKEEPLI